MASDCVYPERSIINPPADPQTGGPSYDAILSVVIPDGESPVVTIEKGSYAELAQLIENHTPPTFLVKTYNEGTDTLASSTTASVVYYTDNGFNADVSFAGDSEATILWNSDNEVTYQ